MTNRVKITMTVTAYLKQEPDMTLEDWKNAAISDPFVVIDQSTEEPEVTVSLVDTTNHYPED